MDGLDGPVDGLGGPIHGILFFCFFVWINRGGQSVRLLGLCINRDL